MVMTICIKNLVCGIPNYRKSLLKIYTNVASILLIFCKLISLYIDVHFGLTFDFSLENFFKLIYLNEAIKHCGTTSLSAVYTQAHHVCYFFRRKRNLKCFHVWPADNFYLSFLDLCQITMRNASTQNKATLYTWMLLGFFFRMFF